MVYEAFMKSKASRTGVIRTTGLDTDHFDKNSNSQMRAYLAFQITSATVDMIKDIWNGDAEKLDDCKTLCEFLELIDELIDVMNAKQKGHIGIDSINTLLDCVRFLEEWPGDRISNRTTKQMRDGRQVQETFLWDGLL